MRRSLVLLLFAVACGPGAEVKSGRELYLAYGCAACHGADADGNGPAAGLSPVKPRDLRDPSGYRGGRDAVAISSVIAFGIADGRTGMPAYPDIPKRERAAIADYLLSLDPPSLAVHEAWVREPVTSIAAAYLRIDNPLPKPVALVGATSNAADVVEIHEMTTSDGMMSMRRIDVLPIAPRSSVTLAPNGAHLMLIDLAQPLPANITFTLTFDDGSTRTAIAQVRNVGRASARQDSARQDRPVGLKPDLHVSAFTLVDHDGRPFHSDSLRGRPALLFFGYTHCPDACPTMMSRVARAYREAGAEAAKIPTLFVSVDPRDTPPVLKEYLSYFAAVPAKGLTGSKAQIDRVVNQFAARYEIRDRVVDHTLYLYLLDAQGRVVRRFDPNTNVEEIADAMRTMLRP